MCFSHRSDEFQELYKEVSERLCHLTGYKNVVFTQGSASSAIETVLSSVLHEDSRLLILVNGEFANRAHKMASFYTKNIEIVQDVPALCRELSAAKYDFCFAVQFETSLSIFNELTEAAALCQAQNCHLLSDVVSAFPYYEPPKSKILLATSSKQLRGLPAMGLIFFDDLSDLCLLERSNYLNLKKYVDYSNKNQTPHTSLIPQFDSLNNALKELDVAKLRRSVTENAKTLIKGLQSHVLNEQICPVVTFKVSDAHTIVEHLRKAGISIYHNMFYMNYYVQVGCFNYDSPANYEELNDLLAAMDPVVWA
jgi:aspartate aminotransferase-like enzyme